MAQYPNVFAAKRIAGFQGILPAIVVSLFAVFSTGCKSKADLKQADLRIEVKAMQLNPQSSPVAGGSSSMETSVETMLWNLGGGPANFDVLTATYYSGERLVCGTTYSLSSDNKVRATFSLRMGDGPPPPSHEDGAQFVPFVIAPNEGNQFVLDSGNCDFGEMKNRKIAVNLLKNGLAVRKPFEILIPDEIED